MKFTKQNWREYLGFLLVGGANTLITYSLYLLLLLVLPYRWSYSLAFAGGIIISYWLNSQFVFQEPVSLLKFVKYPLVYLIQYLLGILILYLCVDRLGISPWLAPLVVVAASLPVTFVISKMIIKGRI